MQNHRSYFSLPRFYLFFGLIAAVAAAVLFSMPSQLFAQEEVAEPPYISGQRVTRKGLIQVALDAETGNTVFIFTPVKAPSPAHANAAAQANLYLIAYPDPDDIPAQYKTAAYDENPVVNVGHLDCSRTNCKGLNVLPMQLDAYGAAPSAVCQHFLNKSTCSPVEGHDHLIGTPFTSGDFNVDWHKVLVVFTPTGIEDGAAGTRITTLQQLETDLGNQWVVEMPVKSDATFNCSLVPEQLYYEGSSVSVNYPDSGDTEAASQP